MKLLYISNGNIPSQWAHTVQIMKMSEAYARLVPSFALLIPGDFRDLLRRWVHADQEVFKWYGIERPFTLRRLPMAWRLSPGTSRAPIPRRSRRGRAGSSGADAPGW